MKNELQQLIESLRKLETMVDEFVANQITMGAHLILLLWGAIEEESVCMVSMIQLEMCRNGLMIDSTATTSHQKA